MTIERSELRELPGTKIRIDGKLHPVAKVVLRSGVITTEDGIVVNGEDGEKKGRTWHFPAPKAARKPKADAKDEKPETPRQKRIREKREAKEAAPTETPRQKRIREKREAKEAGDEKPASNRARNRNKDSDEPAKPKTKIPRNGLAKGEGKADHGVKKKKLFEEFTQAIGEHVSQELFDLLGATYGIKGTYALVPVAVGADFTEQALTVHLTLMRANEDPKVIKEYIRNNRQSTDISPHEEQDNLDDVELDDDDAEDGIEGDLKAQLLEYGFADLKKLAKVLTVKVVRGDDEDELVDRIIEECEEDFIRTSAEEMGMELGDSEEEEEDESLEDDEEEDEEDLEDDEEVSAEELTNEIIEFAPDLKAKSVSKFVEAFLENEEVADKFDGELVPGRTKLQEKGGKGPELLLIGFDEASDMVKLLNTDTLKTRSKTISEVVHMEIVE